MVVRETETRLVFYIFNSRPTASFVSLLITTQRNSVALSPLHPLPSLPFPHRRHHEIPCCPFSCCLSRCCSVCMSTHYITRLFETLTFFFFSSPLLELQSSYSFKYHPDMPTLFVSTA